ncbi:hypothetical protein K431DRAFT_192180, partial [Polychaeton citri CBS 116435]
RSCTTCAKAKAKCVRTPGGGICERCSRLKKECHLREPVVRKRKVVKTTRAAQLEKLESKLENLVNALSTSKARQQLNELGQPSPPTSLTSSTESSEQRDGQQQSQQESRVRDFVQTLCQKDEDAFPQESASNHTSPGNGSSAPTDVCPGVSVYEADLLIDRYRRLLSTAMPFVPLRQDVTVRYLFEKRPFLLHCICCVASFHDLAKQQRMVKNIMREVSERMLINNEKSVDLIQGIMVIVSWYYPHIFWQKQVTNLLHLASAMLKDLAIDRSTQSVAYGDMKASVNKNLNKVVDGPRGQTPQPYIEEHRCLAGIFFLTSSFSSSFRRCDAIKYTSWLDNCLETLGCHREYESDAFLVQMVRLQRVCEDISNTETPNAPLQLYAKSFHAELASIKKAAKEDNDEQPVASILRDLEYKSADVLIWELVLLDIQDSKATDPCLTSLFATRDSKAKRETLRRHQMDGLYNCAKAVRGFIDSWFAIPPSLYLTLPFHVFAQFAHVFILMTRLASLELDGWDIKSVSDIMDLSRILDQASELFDTSAKTAPEGILPKNDCFNKWSQRLRWMKQMYESKSTETILNTIGTAGSAPTYPEDGSKGSVDKEGNVVQTPAASGAVNNNFQQANGATVGMVGGGNAFAGNGVSDDVLSGDFFSYLDDSFWQSFAGDIDL